MKKKLLALSVVAGIIGFAGTANATNDLDTPAAPLAYANELTIDPTDGLVLTAADSTQDVTFTINPNATPSNSDVRVTLTLSNGATFTANPAMAPVETELFTIFAGGAGESTVTFDGNSGDGFSADPVALITMAGITVADNGAVTISVETAIADNFGSTVIKTIPNTPYMEFADSLTGVFTPDPTTDKIDVSQQSLFFTGSEGDNVTVLGTFGLDFTANLNADSTVITDADDLLSELNINLNNASGWAAFNQTSASIGLSGGISCSIGADDIDVIDGDNASIDLSECNSATAADLAVPATVTVTVPADNTVAMTSGAITVTYDGTPQEFFNDDTADTGSLSPLQKNGSSTFINWSPKAGGAFTGFVRITNPSQIAGDVFLTCFDKAGNSSSFDLGDIAGIETSLPAGSSTGLIDAIDITAAAMAASAEYTSTQFRCDIFAEFGTNRSTESVDGGDVFTTSGDTAVRASTFVQSSDGSLVIPASKY